MGAGNGFCKKFFPSVVEVPRQEPTRRESGWITVRKWGAASPEGYQPLMTFGERCKKGEKEKFEAKKGVLCPRCKACIAFVAFALQGRLCAAAAAEPSWHQAGRRERGRAQ